MDSCGTFGQIIKPARTTFISCEIKGAGTSSDRLTTELPRPKLVSPKRNCGSNHPTTGGNRSSPRLASVKFEAAQSGRHGQRSACVRCCRSACSEGPAEQFGPTVRLSLRVKVGLSALLKMTVRMSCHQMQRYVLFYRLATAFTHRISSMSIALGVTNSHNTSLTGVPLSEA
jgi:hypothetical protein